MLHPKTRSLDQKIISVIRQSSKTASFSPKIIDQLFLELFSYQYRHNPNYRQFCELEKVSPQSINDWRSIPAMPVDGFKQFVLTTFPVKKAIRVFKTSGTTQGMTRGKHYFDSLKLYEEACSPLFKKALLLNSKKLPCFFLLASPKELPDSSLSWMMDLVQKRFLAGSTNSFYVQRGVLEADRLIQNLKKAKKPVLILATAFSLASFLDELVSRKIILRLPVGTKLMETGGFKGKTKEISKKALYAKVKKYLGIVLGNCVSEYGMTELSSQFYCVGGDVFKGAPWLRTLIIDPVTGREVAVGKKGIIRIFDLANRGSVAAIQTEDLGIHRREGFELVGRAAQAEIRGCSLTYEEFKKK